MATVSLSSASEAEPVERKADRGQLSPTAALVAVATVGMALSLYATVFAGIVPVPDQNVADPTLERVHNRVVTAGVAAPDLLEDASAVGPDGYRLYVSLRTAHGRWNTGPTPPKNGPVETATRRTAVRTSPGEVRSGHLRVVVWR